MDLPPSAQQCLFARAVIHTLQLWPSMRMAIDEQWGGPESKEKCDFLVSHICDTYGGQPGASTLGVFEPNTAGPSGSNNAIARPAAPSTPEEDELADVLEQYVADEYEAHVEDGSCDYIAGRICSLHRVIFASPSSSEAGQDPIAQEAAAQQVLAAAQAALAPLDEAAEKLRNKRLQSQRDRAGWQGEIGEGESSEDDSDDDMEVDGPAEGSGQVRQPKEKQEPIVDEDGFTTVVGKKKR